MHPPAESAFLLGKLIHGAPRLVLPYVAPIEKALVAKLRSATLLPPPLAAPAGPATKPAKGDKQGRTKGVPCNLLRGPKGGKGS